MRLVFSNNLILLLWRKYDLLKQSSVNLCISVSVKFGRVLRSSKSLFRVSIKTVWIGMNMNMTMVMNEHNLMTSFDTWISDTWVVYHAAALFTNNDEFIKWCLFLFKVGCMISTKYFMLRMRHFL